MEIELPDELEFPEELDTEEEGFGDNLDGISNGRVPVRRVLAGAVKADLEDVLILGYTKDEKLYAASSDSDRFNLILLMEEIKFKLLNGDY